MRTLNKQAAGSLVWLPQTDFLPLYPSVRSSHWEDHFHPNFQPSESSSSFRIPAYNASNLYLRTLLPAHSHFPSALLDSHHPCALEPCWIGEELSTHVLGQFFFFRRYFLPNELPDLFIYSRRFWRNAFLALWIIIYLRHFLTVRSL